MNVDIVIVGAGPAGATLARLLAPHYKVLIVDKRNLASADSFIKPVCCGGLLAPDAQQALAHLGLGIPKDVLVGPQMFSVKTIDLDNQLERYYQRHYINVNREAFDRWLVSLMPSSVMTYYQTFFINYRQTAEGYSVQLRRNQQTEIVNTRLLVAADGAISRIRSLTCQGMPTPDRYISVQKWFPCRAVMPHFYSIFDRSVTDFYSWIIQKDDAVILGTGLDGNGGVRARFNRLEAAMRARGIIDGEPLKQEGTLIMRTRKLSQIHLTVGNIAFIGEAAGLISPSSAEGISYALRSAEYLANAINRDMDTFAVHYRRNCQSLKLNLLIKNIKLHAMYQPALRKLIMQSKLLSMDLH